MLEDLLRLHVEAGTVPGAVAALGFGDPAVVAVGAAAVDGDPMRPDATMRIEGAQTWALMSEFQALQPTSG